MDVRLGIQTPTQSFLLPYEMTKGQEAVDYYNKTGKTAYKWQEMILDNMLAINDEGLWVHTKFGYSVPRRNGKNECIIMRELWGLLNNEKIMHTAHRTTTAHSAWERLIAALEAMGFAEDKDFKTSKQLGMEKITMLVDDLKGVVSFRTRTAKGGLGEGFDLLIIDEAQEYTADQESALKYVVSDSPNPQTIMCGTPPTPVSSGTVFLNYRKACLAGSGRNSGWEEWSVEEQTDPNNKDAWYQTNPSLGTILTERKIFDEIGDDLIDFNIQRLGLWIKYSLKSAISKAEWDSLRVPIKPKFKGKLFVGIKYGKDGTNAAMSIAVKTEDDRVFVEGIDCVSVREGNNWIIRFLRNSDIQSIAVDGASGQKILSEEMKDLKMKQPILPTVSEIILANSKFEQALFAKSICHSGQPSMVDIVSNCEKRAIGSNGGFGYRSIKDGVDVALMDSMILAHWLCCEAKVKKKQKISY